MFNKGTKGLAMDREGCGLKIVDVVDADWQAAGVTVHDTKNRALAHMLIDLRVTPAFADFPIALGVIYDDPRPTFEQTLLGQDVEARKGKEPDLAKLLAKGQTWTVSGTAADPV